MKALRTSLLVGLALTLGLAWPGLAAACPMCLSGQGGGTGRAFALGSLMLSVTPLAVIGAGVWYLRRRARALDSAAARPERRLPADCRPTASR